jgi:SAM-dependent methyltransferase
VYAVDREARAVEALRRLSAQDLSNVTPVRADFTHAFSLPHDKPLDGILLANSLHFVRNAEAVLADLALLLRRGGRVVLVEYDARSASPWVPYPIPVSRLPALASAAGLSKPIITATRPSVYTGTLYVAAADRMLDPGALNAG